jgi:hypothetical protein
VFGADELAPPPDEGVAALGAETVGAETVGAETVGVDTAGAETFGVDTPGTAANAVGATRPSTPIVTSAAATRTLFEMSGR